MGNTHTEQSDGVEDVNTLATYDKVSELPESASFVDRKQIDDGVLLAMDDEGNLFNLGPDVMFYRFEE